VRPVFRVNLSVFSRRVVRRVRRRGWGMVRSFVVQLVSLGLVLLGILARAAESSDAAVQMDRSHRIEATQQSAPDLEPNGVASFDRKPARDIRAKL
jgi:hypothetical protein